LPISRPRFFYYDEAGLTAGYSEVEGGVMNMLAAQTPYTGTVAGVEVQANALNNKLIVGSSDDTADTLIGGRGTDNFTAIRDFTRVQVAVQVVNFDVRADILTVSQNTSTDVIVFTFDTAQNRNRCRASSGSSTRIRCRRHTKHPCCVCVWCLSSCRSSTCTGCGNDDFSVTRPLVLQVS
jgi:hypothetical protein